MQDVVLFVLSGFLTVINGLFGWLLKMYHDRLKTVEEDNKDFPSIYARRDDVKDMKQEIVSHLQRIEDKIEKRIG